MARDRREGPLEHHCDGVSRKKIRSVESKITAIEVAPGASPEISSAG
jgi:hypothetical protein